MDVILMALRSLRSNFMRTVLTLLGMLIGISSVIAILTLGSAANVFLNREWDSLGFSNMEVSVGREDVDNEDALESLDKSEFLTEQDLQDYREAMGSRITGMRINYPFDTEGEVQKGSDSSDTTSVFLYATDPNNLDYDGEKIRYGRSLTEDDIAAGANVIVLSNRAFETIFNGNINRALNHDLDITFRDGDVISYTIIGVFEPKVGFLANLAQFGAGYVPYTTLMAQNNGDQPTWTSFSVKLADREDPTFEETTQQYFREFYNDDTIKVTTMTIEGVKEFIDRIMLSLSLGISAIAAIALLVGGIGVMNIMLVAVTERTREIGIRKALGAKTKDIRLQFLSEAMIICFIGGAVGVVLGALPVVILSIFFNIFVLPPWWGVLGALAFSVGIGLFFGYYPANKAAKLNPIDALRYE